MNVVLKATRSLLETKMSTVPKDEIWSFVKAYCVRKESENFEDVCLCTSLAKPPNDHFNKQWR